jgi:hypothetical protein
MVRARENLFEQALSFCGFAPAAHGEIERRGKQARLREMQQSLWART